MYATNVTGMAKTAKLERDGYQFPYRADVSPKLSLARFWVF
jgi:hypothetical protein